MVYKYHLDLIISSSSSAAYLGFYPEPLPAVSNFGQQYVRGQATLAGCFSNPNWPHQPPAKWLPEPCRTKRYLSFPTWTAEKKPKVEEAAEEPSLDEQLDNLLRAGGQILGEGRRAKRQHSLRVGGGRRRDHRDLGQPQQLSGPLSNQWHLS